MNKNTSLKASVIQMVSTHRLDKNFKRINILVCKASQAGSRLIVLPENCLMFSSSSFLSLAQDITLQERIFDFFSRLAKTNECFIVAGTIPMPTNISNKVYSACVVFSPDGKEVARYYKIHLFDADVGDKIERYRESNTIMPGDQVVCFDMDGVKVGIGICYDLRFPELFRALSAQGCQVLVLPSAFTYKTGEMHWHVLLKARAIENQCFMLAANQGGEHLSAKGVTRRTYGHSMIVDPQGKVLASCGLGEGVCVADLDFSALVQIRKQMPVLKHRWF